MENQFEIARLIHGQFLVFEYLLTNLIMDKAYFDRGLNLFALFFSSPPKRSLKVARCFPALDKTINMN
jgi:hypothetical protein